MELKKIIAGVVTASVAISGAAVSAFADDATVGNTELPADAAKITLKSTGSMKFDGAYRVNICNPWEKDDDDNLLEEYNILTDKTELSGSFALGVHFDVAEFDEYGKSFNVDINIEENNGKAEQSYMGNAETAVGVTTAPVTVDGDGDYIVWANFEQPLDADSDNFFFDITTDIKEEIKTATTAAGDGLPVIRILEIGVQDMADVPGVYPPTVSEPEDTGKPDGGDNVDTGVTLAVVPAALSAAALIAAGISVKKRK